MSCRGWRSGNVHVLVQPDDDAWRLGARRSAPTAAARVALSSLAQAAHGAQAGAVCCRIRLKQAILPTTPNHTPTRRAGCKVISWAPHCKTPPTTLSLAFSFSSLIPALARPAAARTPCFFPSSAHCTSARKICVSFASVRTYASAKKKKMPPKKQVKEEKILLGRPGNSLKSGIVSESPAWCCCRVLTLTVVARSA